MRLLGMKLQINIDYELQTRGVMQLLSVRILLLFFLVFSYFYHQYSIISIKYPLKRFLADGNFSGPSLSKYVIIPLWYVSKYLSQHISLISNGNNVLSSSFNLAHKYNTLLLLNIHSLVEKYSNMSVNVPIFLY